MVVDGEMRSGLVGPLPARDVWRNGFELRERRWTKNKKKVLCSYPLNSPPGGDCYATDPTHEDEKRRFLKKKEEGVTAFVPSPNPTVAGLVMLWCTRRSDA